MKFRVYSLRIEKIRTYNDREGSYEDNKVYVLNCIDTRSKTKYEVRLWEIYGNCYSGYCKASWAYIEFHKVDSFIGMTHKPIKELEFTLLFDEYGIANEIKNDIFYYFNGGDQWYPAGVVEFNEELFEPINRNMEKRPVWVFRGDSALGKSYLSGIIANSDRKGLSVYETDAHEELTEINDNIVVIGNKYNYSIEDIEKHIAGEHETILVDFSKLEDNR